MHDSFGGAQELYEERGPSAAGGDKVHYFGDNGGGRVESAAEGGQLTRGPLMLGIRLIKKCHSRSRIEQERP